MNKFWTLGTLLKTVFLDLYSAVQYFVFSILSIWLVLAKKVLTEYQLGFLSTSRILFHVLEGVLITNFLIFIFQDYGTHRFNEFI